MYRLFDELAHRYDLHTPPHHYHDDHAFVLEVAGASGRRLLDVGCGTGVFVAKAREAGFDASGIDASHAMIRVASQRLDPGMVAVLRMQDLASEAEYDCIVALSWTLHYCQSKAELLDVLKRFRRALRPGGRIVLQLAHAAHADGSLLQDREPGPDGRADDVLFLYRFREGGGLEASLIAEYVYACQSQNELLYEQHRLQVADAHHVSACAVEAGFVEPVLYDSWRRDPFSTSQSPFLVAKQGAGS